jgi:Dolichyl-phosphate-mannose-protein mannosyltransferase
LSRKSIKNPAPVPPLQPKPQPDSALLVFLERRALLLVLLFLAIGCARIISTYSVFSTTADEPAHIACGMEYVANHVYKLETQHPPLTRAMIAFLPYLNGTRPRGIPNFQNEGWALITYERHPDTTVFLMRLGNLPFFVLGGLVVFFWARRYFGGATAALATLLYTLLPPVLAHAGLATTDMGLAACVGAAFLAAIVWAEEPTTRHALLFGVFSALAVLSKFTALGFYPLGLGFALVCYLAAERPSVSRLVQLARDRAPSFGIALAAGIFVWWAAFYFSFGKVPHWTSTIPVPAPEFFDGIEVALNHNRTGHASFLLGQISNFGWWYYFPVALAVKTPIAFLVLLASGLVIGWKRRPRLPWLLTVAFALGVLVPSMMGHINIGVRHILPVYLAFSILAALTLVQLLRWIPARRWAAPAAAILSLWLIFVGVLHHPDYLPYFNEFVSNPEAVLLDSNYDWGQDLKRVAARLHQLGAQWVNYGYINGGDGPFLEAYPGLPKIHPIHPLEPAEGWTVVSPTMHRTTQYGLEYRYPDLQPWFEVIAPQERIGTQILYFIPPGTLKRIPMK